VIVQWEVLHNTWVQGRSISSTMKVLHAEKSPVAILGRRLGMMCSDAHKSGAGQLMIRDKKIN
jgi:N-formylglutamate amidohydrolase